MPAIEDLTIAVKVDDQASSPLDSILNKVKEIDRVTKSSGFVHLKEVSKSLADFSKAASGLNGVAENFTKISKASNEFSKNLGALGKANLSNATKQLNDIGNAVNKFNTSALSTKGFSFNVSGASSIARMPKLLREVGSNFAFAASKGKEFATIPLKMIFAPLGGVMQRVKNLGSAFSGLLTTIKRVAVMRAIRAGIRMISAGVREGVNNLYLWASAVGNSFVPTMDSLATSFQYLKNSIGAAASPILDVLAPAVEVAVNKFVELLNVFNQVISSITGASTWRKALRAPASYSDSISGLGHDATDANDAVKELKRTLLGFDEINRLDDATKTVSPKVSGKDATGYYAKDGALSFTELPISQKALDIAKMLKDAWAKGDFTSIGTMIGEKIGTALLHVPWEQKIQPAVQKLATSAGTLINGMFDYNGRGGKAMWDGIAYTIYNALNTAILGYVTFFDSVEWEGIGEGIGAALKDVCEHIKWDWMAEALASFPNAVIDTLTGFTAQFTTQDFFTLGQNIGNTVSEAITKIKWFDLFKNTFKIATGIVAAFNGALTSFDWSSVKSAILGGIKKIPKKTWSDLGTQIGLAIFNITVFVANLVDTFVSFVEAGNWGALFDGIKTGISNGLKQYGGWKGVAKKLGDWIVEHIGTLSIILALAVGLPLLKALPAAFATTVMNGLKLKQVPGTGTPLGAWAKNLSLAAGIVLAINTFGSIWGHDFKKSSIKDNLKFTLKSGFEGALAGALIGFKFGGIHGALIGATIGLALTLAVVGLNWDPFSEETRAEIDKGLQKNIDQEIADAAANLDTLDLNKQNQLETYYQNREYGAGNTGSNVTTGTLTVSLDPKAAPNAWDQLVKQWQGIVSIKKVAAFLTKGIVNKAVDWWKSTQGFWENAINGKTASKFNIAGIVDKASTWWSNVQQYWSRGIAGKTASRFNIAGIVDKATDWWSDVKRYWSSKIANDTASKFSIAGIIDDAYQWWTDVQDYWSSEIDYKTADAFEIDGVVNDAWSWWYDVQDYWSDVVDGDSLDVSVEIGNAYNAFVGAWNTIQGEFSKKKNYIMAYVKTVTTNATNFSKAYQGKASGGVYKDGRWHDVTAFAAGGFPTGEMFIAREAGPELVGTIGGNTAVVNNDQIVASVSAGVAQAVASVLASGGTNEITINVDSETLYRAVRKGERKASGRYGTAIAIG